MPGRDALTMDQPVLASLLDTGAQGLIGAPIERTEGRLKVSGSAPYSAEYAFPGLAYGVLVGAPFARGTVTAIDASVAKAMPGVIDVVSDLNTFLRNPQQAGTPKAPTQGVRDVRYAGEIVAIVVAESFEAGPRCRGRGARRARCGRGPVSISGSIVTRPTGRPTGSSRRIAPKAMSTRRC